MAEEVVLEGMKEAEGTGVSGEKGKQSETVGGAMTEIGQPLSPEVASEKTEGKYLELLSKVTPTKTASATDEDHEDTVTLDAKHIGAMTDEASKVQKLLDLASTKGVVHAVKVARSLRDYYALDRMHDELSGGLYQGLLERGLIHKE